MSDLDERCRAYLGIVAGRIEAAMTEADPVRRLGLVHLAQLDLRAMLPAVELAAGTQSGRRPEQVAIEERLPLEAMA